MTFQHPKLFIGKLMVFEEEEGLSKYHEVIDFVLFKTQISMM